MVSTENKEYDIAVVGAGPGGYTAAIYAAQKGLKVALIEGSKTLGGTCLNVGCIPSKALIESSHLYHKLVTEGKEHGLNVDGLSFDWTQIQKRKNSVVRRLTQGIASLMKKNRVEVIQGWAKFVNKNALEIATESQEKILVKAKNIIIATGSTPTELPHIPSDGINVLNSTHILSLDKIPQSLCIIGAGVIGLEMATIYSAFGTKIHIIEALPQLLPLFDSDISGTLKEELTAQGCNFHLGCKVSSVKTVAENNLILNYQDEDGQTHSIECEKVLSVVGRKPNSHNLNLEQLGINITREGFIPVNTGGQTTTGTIWAVGDVIGQPMLAHKAEEEAKQVVDSIVDGVLHPFHHQIPSVIYTHPEVASLGLSEQNMKNKGYEYNKGKFPFLASGRALSSGNSKGFVKVITDKYTDEIVGISIIGEQASELIGEATVILGFKATAEDVSRLCHAHPTLHETIKEACSLAHRGKTINY